MIFAEPQRDLREEHELDRLVERRRRLGGNAAADRGQLVPPGRVRRVLLRHRVALVADAPCERDETVQGGSAGVVEHALLVHYAFALAACFDLVQEASHAHSEELLVVRVKMAGISAGERRHGRDRGPRLLDTRPFSLRGLAPQRPADDTLARLEVHRHSLEPLRAPPGPPHEPVLLLRVPVPALGVDQLAVHQRSLRASVQGQRLVPERGDRPRQLQGERLFGAGDGHGFGLLGDHAMCLVSGPAVS